MIQISKEGHSMSKRIALLAALSIFVGCGKPDLTCNVIREHTSGCPFGVSA